MVSFKLKTQMWTCSVLILSQLINGCASSGKPASEESHSPVLKAWIGQTGVPDLKDPKVEARWIEDRIFGNRFIEGHYEYLITEPAHWESGK